MSPLAMCVIAKSFTILSEIVPFPQPGGPMISALNILGTEEAISTRPPKSCARATNEINGGATPCKVLELGPMSMRRCIHVDVVVPVGIQRVAEK